MQAQAQAPRSVSTTHAPAGAGSLPAAGSSRRGFGRLQGAAGWTRRKEGGYAAQHAAGTTAMPRCTGGGGRRREVHGRRRAAGRRRPPQL